MIHLVKIESLKKAKKKGFYDVETSIGKYKLSEDVIVKYSVLKGNEFSEEEFFDIIEKANDDKIISSVFNYISYQMRSQKEIVDYLTVKEANDDLIQKCVANLIGLHYIDDALLANYIFTSCLSKHKGPKFLEQKLYTRGISKKDIENVLAKYDNDLEYDIIEEVIDNLVEKYKEFPIKKQKQKISEKLIRDGFSSAVVYYYINKLKLEFKNNDKLIDEIRKIIQKNIELEGKALKNKIITKLMYKGYEYSDIIKSLVEIQI